MSYDISKKMRAIFKALNCVTDVEKKIPMFAAVGAWPCIPANNGPQTTARTRYGLRCYNVGEREWMATACSNCNKTPRPHLWLGPAMQDTRLQVSFSSCRKAPKIQFTLSNSSKVRPHHTDTDTRGMLSCVDRKYSQPSRCTSKSCQI